MKNKRRQIFFAFLIFGMISPLALALTARASGLDVQLKDLRNSFFYLSSNTKTGSGGKCKKLVAQDIRAFGRLIHCNPEDDHVVCPLKSREKLYAFEVEASCEKHLKER